MDHGNAALVIFQEGVVLPAGPSIHRIYSPSRRYFKTPAFNPDCFQSFPCQAGMGGW
jgi:hypothetical protein